ncbi:hypothetical protein [Variovorax sp. JS1663]|uniref:hypothetical protein n=1 Tax=Variovorax sp. JS1663 TaxID=1851577 RepID=UPI000B65975C|nr:hypothetical protein [Variovorax sp. JS1663]OUL98030.1 hypothetical protein A8M77_33665 [Variovorax sp. JS1663]
MTPQSHFVVVAAIAPGREAGLRKLLDGMNQKPGLADRANAVLPFGDFPRLHFARLAVLGDATMGNLEEFGLPRPRLPTYLVFMGDCDGPADALLAEMVQHAGQGMRRIFSHCRGLDVRDDLLDWLLDHDRPVAAPYVNRIGRTVQQIREESALQQALAARVPRGMRDAAVDPLALRRDLLNFVRTEQAAGRLLLTPPAPTPRGWWIGNALHALALPAAALLLSPLVVLSLPVVLWLLRRHETRDPEYCPRPDPEAVREMQELEDHDLSNSFTALGAVKPGWFRRMLVQVLLWLIAWACRHVFGRGHLARVRTIHFAHWVFLDNKTRVLFASNYDGSHEAYMDDFINKVAWGLNLVFSNGFGWPRTAWLIHQGARRELPFKYYQRGHQLPTQVWYKAYPGLTLSDLERNRRIREGFDRVGMSDAEALAWLRLL